MERTRRTRTKTDIVQTWLQRSSTFDDSSRILFRRPASCTTALHAALLAVYTRVINISFTKLEINATQYAIANSLVNHKSPTKIKSDDNIASLARTVWQTRSSSQQLHIIIFFPQSGLFWRKKVKKINLESTFSSRVTDAWNSQSNDVVKSPSVCIFKKQLHRELRS